MKAYGVPRNNNDYPDKLDIQYYGFNFSAGGKDYFKNKQKKRNTRRVWKKLARNEAKKECKW